MTTDEVLKFVLERGKRYKPAVLPEGMRRGKLGRCFDNAMMAAMDRRDLTYVEGVAMTIHPKTRGKWILHAWLTDGEHAFDPTWYAIDDDKKEVPMPTVYFGVEMGVKDVAQFMMETEYAGVFANAHRAPELFEQIVGPRHRGVASGTGIPRNRSASRG